MLKFSAYILFFAVLYLPINGYAQYEDQHDSVRTVEVAPSDEHEPGDNASFVFHHYTKGAGSNKKTTKRKVDELKKDDAYWYANVEPQKPEQTQTTDKSDSNSLFNQKWFQDLLWIIILCSFIAIVIWYLASSNVRLFRKESKKIIEDDLAEEWADDIFTINYEKEIKKAEDANNYRSAVRLWYLKTLKELSERNIIDYRHERTNSEYLNSLFGGRHYKDFFRLTRNFEYTWYGQFPLSAEAYQMMQTDFRNFKNSLAR